jgi:3-dehydro-L-gulonate 2-dehydrogenase
MFARTTESGVYSHGVNRFPRFIQQLDNGDIIPEAKPQRVTSLGAIEQWDAQRSIGNLTAKKMMDRAIELASDHGIGLVALRNANHWMRGGSYGWQAAEKGYIGICWTNSIAVMPPWGAKECRIGTNPLIVAIPSTPITMVDMSMSMFSYGMLEVNRLAGRELPVDGGFDDEGQPDQRTGRYREKPPYSANGLLERFRPVDRAGYDCHPAFQRLFRCRSDPGKQR